MTGFQLDNVILIDNLRNLDRKLHSDFRRQFLRILNAKRSKLVESLLLDADTSNDQGTDHGTPTSIIHATNPQETLAPFGPHVYDRYYPPYRFLTIVAPDFETHCLSEPWRPLNLGVM